LILNIEIMRNKLLIGFIFFAVLATQFSCSQMRQMELERNRSLWHESKIKDYKMKVKIQKTGHATPNGKFIIIVRGGVAKSIKSVDFKPGLEMLDTEIQFGRYSTIGGIFSFIESAEKDNQKNNRGWSRREIEYDSKFGYPKKVDLDQSGVFDDELSFEVLEFEAIDSSDSEPAEKSSPPKLNLISASEITKAEFSTKYHYGPLGDSDESNTSSGGVSFSRNGTAFRYYDARHYDTGKKQDTDGEKFQAVVSIEQFQNFAQTIADNDFSNLKDSTERTNNPIDYMLLTVTYAGKTKTIKANNSVKNTAEVKAILQAFETLKNQVDWK